MSDHRARTLERTGDPESLRRARRERQRLGLECSHASGEECMSKAPGECRLRSHSPWPCANAWHQGGVLIDKFCSVSGDWATYGPQRVDLSDPNTCLWVTHARPMDNGKPMRCAAHEEWPSR